MKKHLLALVILGAIASAAKAQSNATLYGTLDDGLGNRTDQRRGLLFY